MSMIDYDAKPVTPQVLLVGHRASAVGYSIRDFLSRNGVPYEWVDVDDQARVGALLPAEERGVDQLPVCVLPNGMRLAPATLEGVVTRVDWQNPHVHFFVDVQQADGSIVNWNCETRSPNRLEKGGWTRDSLKPGDKVVVRGDIARDSSHSIDGRQVTLADGRKILSVANTR